MTQGHQISQRLLRKGALVEDTYAVFEQWDESRSLEQNLEGGLRGRYRTESWANEIRVTLHRRFRDPAGATALIALAREQLPIGEWASCLLLWIGLREPLFGDFVREWLAPESAAGTYRLRTEDVAPYVTSYWKPPRVKSKPLSAYGALRTARDLLRMARDLGLMKGDGPAKTFAASHLSERCFVYWAHVIAEHEGGRSRVPGSREWRLGLMSPGDVEQELLRLHQFRKVEYQVAGSLVQLDLPCSTSLEYAETMVP